MLYATRILLAAALLIGIQTNGEAGAILKLDLIADGSTQPPGDVVNVSVLLFPGEQMITLELRAFTRSGAPPVKSSR